MQVAILAGGSGTRLWPLSRTDMPKQFLKLLNGNTSLLQESIKRNVSENAHIILVTGKSYKHLCQQQMDEMGIRGTILIEPSARNTAPAIALTLKYLKDRVHVSENEKVLFVPSDHLIKPIDTYRKALHFAKQAAHNKNTIVTFGIVPTEPATGYGYIEALIKEPHDKQSTKYILPVRRFVEKPDKESARKYIQSKKYFWNSGMFMFTVKTGWNAFKHHAPELFRFMQMPYQEFLTEFPNIPGISFDYAVMEKAENVSVIPLELNWSDVGSWNSIHKISERKADANGNKHDENTVCIDSKNCYIHTNNRTIATVGVQNLAIIDTPDALLITKQSEDQKVRNIVDLLKTKSSTKKTVTSSSTSFRPWGSFTVLADKPDYKLKEIRVNPGQRLSLQRHQHRSEHWTVLEGTAQVVLGENELTLQSGESVFIPVKTKHRLANLTPNPVRIIELQTGTYFGEDDIERFEDEYGRA